MTFTRPKAAVLGLAATVALLAGCGPTDGAAAPVPTVTTTAAAAVAPSDVPVTGDPTAAVAPTTAAPAVTAAKQATTKKPSAKPTVHKPASKPTTKKPAPKPTTTAPAGKVVHPGAFCSPEGATGYTSKGTRMRCTRKAGENQPRWRAA